MRLRTLPGILATFALVAACRRSESQETRGEAQIVALTVRSEPPGAKVRVNALSRTWTTPCDVADFSLRRGVINVELSLDGHIPATRQVEYNGIVPTHVEVNLRPKAAVAQDPPPPSNPLGAGAPAPSAVAGGRLRLKPPPGTKMRVKLENGAVIDAENSNDIVLPDVASGKVTVEFIDAKTGATTGMVEFLPAPARELVVPPPVEGDRVGQVRLVHRVYGVFVKLDPGLNLNAGEEILVYRDGKEVARTKILKIFSGDETYPDGGVQLPREKAEIKKGDEVRRPKQ